MIDRPQRHRFCRYRRYKNRVDGAGLLSRIDATDVNRRAVSRVRLVDDAGYPADRVAFLIVDTGSPGDPGRGGFWTEGDVRDFDDGGDRFSDPTS